ncbi:MAG: AI-2E family transporter [Oscillospiraceae bacterium]
MNSEDKRKIKIGIAISAFSILFFIILQNFSKVQSALNWFLSLFSSFIIGVCIAFVLNIIMSSLENKIFKKIKWFQKKQKIIRPISIVLTLVIFLGALTALFSFIIPQVIDSAKTLSGNMQGYIESLQNFLNKILSQFGISTDVYEAIVSMFSSVSDKILSYLTEAVPKILLTTKNITNGIMNFFVGFVFAIYMLASKEVLLKNSKKMIYAFLPKNTADYLQQVYRLAKSRFSGFVTGQLTEAFILGILCFIGMKIFGMEYAPLISVIVGITNMVPIVGPIIGSIPGVLIMLMVKPIMALWFIIFIVVLQQLESNLIYPKVVGESTGLPGIWVLFSIVVGGNLFGFIGILMGVPVFAVIYTLIGYHTNAKLKQKGLKI